VVVPKALINLRKDRELRLPNCSTPILMVTRPATTEEVRFAADVTFEGPLTNGKILGKPALQKFLSTVRAKDVRVKRQIIDGQFACVLSDFETPDGTTVPFCEFFRIRDGEIAEIRPYLILVP
jgi:hypothetical protein